MGATGTKHFKITFKQELLWYHPNIIRSFEPNIPQAPQIDLFHNTDLGTTLNFSEMSNYYIFFGWICLHCWPFLSYETRKCQRNVMMRSFLLVIKLSIILKAFMAETLLQKRFCITPTYFDGINTDQCPQVWLFCFI